MNQAVSNSKISKSIFSKSKESQHLDPYAEKFRGYYIGMTKWSDLDQLWLNVKSQMDDQWFIYALGHDVPEQTTNSESAHKFVDEIDILLRKEHGEDYCGIVYVDDVESPAFIKIFDPNNLGVSCGFSDNPPLPGWVMSKMKPCDLNVAFPPPKSRQRWWKSVFS